jgi:hypothetical protein
MDPVSLIFALAMKNPQATSAAIDSYNTPGKVEVAQLHQSVADFAMQALNCYHKSARFRGVDIIGSPWVEERKFGAQKSVVLRIYFSGFSGANYQMIIAAMARDKNYRTFVMDENTLIPYNKNCELEKWTFSQIN